MFDGLAMEIDALAFYEQATANEFAERRTVDSIRCRWCEYAGTRCEEEGVLSERVPHCDGTYTTTLHLQVVDTSKYRTLAIIEARHVKAQ